MVNKKNPTSIQMSGGRISRKTYERNERRYQQGVLSGEILNTAKTGEF
jgi:hypothetical protein